MLSTYVADSLSTYMYLLTYVVIDALLPSDDDIMSDGGNDSYTFKNRMRGRNNVPLPGIRVPMRVVQNRSKRAEGQCCNMCIYVNCITSSI